MNEIDILVIGGGISGLSVAGWLAQAGVSVEVWEQETRPGGKIQSISTEGYLMERAASMILNFRPEVTDFMEKSGLEAHKMLRTETANRYLVHKGQLLSLPMKLGPMITSPLWSLRGKLRLFLEPFITKGGKAQQTVSEFITRRLAYELLEKAMGPYVTGTLASDPDKANAYSVLPRLTALEQRYGSLTMGIFMHRLLQRRTASKTEAFSFKGGMSTLIDFLVTMPGVFFRPKYRVTGLEKDKLGWRVTRKSLLGEHTVWARQVILTTPADVTASLVTSLDSQLANTLRHIEMAPLSVVHLGFPRSAIPHSLDGTGFLTPHNEAFAVKGCLWMSSLFPDRTPQDKVLLSAYLGGATQPIAVDWDNERSIAEVLVALRHLVGLKRDPEMVRIDRHYQGLPLYHGDYSHQLAEMTKRLKRLPGLYLEGNYRGGISVRDRIAHASKTAQLILAERDQNEM